LCNFFVQDVRGARSNETATPVNVVFASGSMIRLFACSQNICTQCKCFANKHGFFRPAGGESGRLSRHMPGLEPTAYVLLWTS